MKVNTPAATGVPFEGSAEPTVRLTRPRVLKIGCELEEGHQNEEPFGHEGMRNNEIGSLDDEVLAEKDVEIKGAGASAHLFHPCPPEIRLDPLKLLQHPRRCRGGPRFSNSIQVQGLILHVERTGFVDAGEACR